MENLSPEIRNHADFRRVYLEKRDTPKATVGEFKSWWDLTEEEQDGFRKYVVEHNVRGWDELKEACTACGFEADENMPTLYELREDAPGAWRGGQGVMDADVVIAPEGRKIGWCQSCEAITLHIQDPRDGWWRCAVPDCEAESQELTPE